MSSPNEPELEPEEINGTLNQIDPVLAYCPTCARTVVTEVQLSYSKIAHLTCIACIMAGCFAFGCCLLPYFSMCFATAKHYCPDCRTRLGSYNRILAALY